jgi:hypothetical protein
MLVLAGIATLSTVRGLASDAQRGAFVDCDGCFVGIAFGADLGLLALALLMSAVLLHWPRRGLRWAMALSVAALAVVMFVDAGVMSTLGHRLLFADLRLYGTEWGAATDLAIGWFTSAGGVAAIGGGLAVLTGLAIGMRGRDTARASGLPAFGLAVAAAVGASLVGTPRYLDLGFYQNVIAIQTLDSGLRHHSDAFAARYYVMAAPELRCQAWNAPAAPKKVFVLVLESWSLHHSALFSGLSNQTPRLDAWARRGRWYPDLVSNAYSTEAALISLLNGSVPIPSHRSWGATAFRDVEHDWHRRLNAEGAWTGFFTSGNLGFGDREVYLKQIGVMHREGAEHAHYAGLPRGAFEAASDRALFQRVLNWYDEERGEAPFMATVLTVGTHPPFVDSEPHDPHEPGEAAALRRMDIATSDFLEALEARGFFRDGMVFVTGDHRAMTPIGNNEVAMFGDTSGSRVPGFVLGPADWQTGAAPGAFQHTDLIPSLHAVATGEDCRNDWQGRMFGDGPVPARVAVYAHPAWRNELRVIVNGQRYRLRLDGDDTAWVGPAPPDGSSILDEAIRQRLSRDPEAL